MTDAGAEEPQTQVRDVVWIGKLPFLDTPTDEPMTGTRIRPEWGFLVPFGSLLMLLAIAAVFPKADVTALLPFFALTGFLFGLAVWDAPRMPAKLRAVAPVAGAISLALLVWFLDAASAKKTVQNLGMGQPYTGLALLTIGVLWFRAKRNTGGFFVIAGAGMVLGASFLNGRPEWWPTIPVFFLTYAPLVLWKNVGWVTRWGGFGSNALVLAAIYDALPVGLLDSSWVLLALPLLYLLAMVLVHVTPDENRRKLAWWLGGLLITTVYLSSFADSEILRWLPIPELLIGFIVLGALAHVAGPRISMASRWTLLLLAVAHGVVGLSTWAARVRLEDPVWESVLLVFAAVGVAVLVFRPEPSLFPAPKPATTE
ncbi:MAG: hypothetical protein ACPHK8_01225 [Thermoplasmatota archaeon]